MAEPKRSNLVNNIFSILLGVFLIVEGIWGLFSGITFGIFTTNITHALVHIVLGITGIIAGIKQNAGPFCTLLGTFLLIIGIIWFIFGRDSFFVRLLNVNQPVAVMNCIAGFLCLSVVYYKRPGVLKN